MISVPGIGSGLDINNLVSQLVAVERDPVVNSLGIRQTELNTDISSLGSLKSALSTFKTSITGLKDISGFEKRTAISNDEEVFTATADATAIAGEYSIEVRNLAESHKLITTGFASEDSVVGNGTLTLTVGSVSVNIEIDNTNNTLAGIRTAINENAASIGVSATIVNVDDGSGGTESKLVLTSTNTGEDNAITVTVDDTTDGDDTDASGLSVFYYDTGDATTPEQLTQTQAAEDAEIRIDGQTVTNAGNLFVNAIEGVTLTAVKEDIGVTKDLTIELDKSAVIDAVNQFIGGYNTVIATVNSLSSFDSDTGETGALFGDSTLRLVTNQIRSDISNPVTGLTGQIKNLVDIGITTTSTGLLQLDSETLESIVETSFDEIGQLFASSGGIAARLDTTLDGFVGAGGVIDSRTDGLNTQLKLLDEEFFRLDRRLVSLEARLIKQFTAMDTLISQLQSSSDFLAQQFANISNINNRDT